MKIDIICPLYNAEDYILSLNKSLMMQKKVNINKIRYVLTKSNDNTKYIMDKNKIEYKLINKNDFSHSLTREKEAFSSNSDILVFITQDIVIEDDLWLYNLVHDIQNGICVAAYSRQISKYNNLEKYTREFNYPNKSKIMSKKDISKFGLKTFFFSDASSAIKRDIFIKLNGYDNKNLPISEDMYIAYKIIMNNYKIKYESKSIVYHSHKFTLKELYDRYKLTGKFFKDNAYLDNYGTNRSGFNMAIYILKRSLKEFNIRVLIYFPINMLVRYFAMKKGKSGD